MTIGLYKITNTVNGKYYIGSSKNIEKRWLCHKSKLSNNNHENVHLQASFNKHGINAFVYEIIKELPKDTTKEELFAHEQDLFNAATEGEWNTKMYNIRKVADCKTGDTSIGHLISTGLKKKWLDPEFRTYMEQHRRKDYTMSEETKQKISKANKGKKQSPEAIENNRLSKLGVKHSKERVQKRTQIFHNKYKGSGKGVRQRSTGKFYAEIYHKSERIYLGSYATYEEALRARLEGEAKYWG
ncbi:MAG: GIY-YIG nuclease family protein [Cytophagales bacterium]|nr:GIY-YIG nuclease family protein [Cytophagales bacterium]